MEKSNYPLICYVNGEIVVEGENVRYVNGEQFFIFVSSNQSFGELSGLICEELEIDSTQFVFKIKVKFPSARGYQLISLNNDRSLRAMWCSVYQSNAPSIDLYVETIPIQQSTENPISSSFQNNTNFVTMLNEVMRGGESLMFNNIDQDEFDGNVNGAVTCVRQARWVFGK
ncbi:hypothetical protein RND81_02G211700 [Saponaria officinalis]|uniref:PB1 domain-containing protein n=1 Tax=Saponaria officinalis TaxID=3572 RepID=A0AAW1MXV6_SAPOF